MFRWMGAIAFAAMLAGPATAHLGLLPPLIGFGVFTGSAVIGLAAAVGGAITWHRSSKLRDANMGREARGFWLGIVPVLAVGIPFGYVMSQGHPRLNDVSTDRAQPPTSKHLSKVYPDSAAQIVSEQHTGIQPLATALPAHELFMLALEVAKRRDDWTVTTIDDTAFSGHATSRLFKFKDDFVVRIRSTSSGSVLDVRSASRDGKNDFGANAKRVKKYLDDVGSETAAQLR